MLRTRADKQKLVEIATFDGKMEQLKVEAKAAADKTAVLAAIADARRIHHELHPEHRHPWYEGGMGRGIGFLALVLLGFGCYLLARKGARWEMEKG